MKSKAKKRKPTVEELRKVKLFTEIWDSGR
jgi:hypothetical protein